MKRALRLTAAAAFVSSVAGCGLFTDADPDIDGARLLEHAVGRPAWSTDGREILFTLREGSRTTRFTLEAIDVASGRNRRLAAVDGWNTGGEQTRTSTDPAFVYFSVANASGSLQYSVYRVPAEGGSAERLASNAGWPWFTISADGSRIAFQGPTHRADTVQVVALTGDRATAAIPTLGARPQVMALSPDGSTVVYSADGSVYEAPVDGGPHRLLWQHSATTYPEQRLTALSGDVFWDGTTPHLLIAALDADTAKRTLRVYDIDGATGESTLLATILGPLTAPWSLARSRDGDSFAAWVPVTLVQQNVERNTYRFHLFVKTPSMDSPKSVLQWSAGEGLPWLEFSPDERRLGFVLYGRLYFTQLPRSS